MTLIEATIRVPDVGTFRYVGKSARSNEDLIRGALGTATLDETRRKDPYDDHNGIRMYRTDDLCRSRRAATFGLLDRLAKETTMRLVTGSVSYSCERYLATFNATRTVKVCEALGEYAGVYVVEWSLTYDWVEIPDSERPLLSNYDS